VKEIRIQNVIASASFKQVFDLTAIANAFPRDTEFMKRFRAPCLVFRMKKPQTTIIVFRRGKMVCTGAKSEREVREAIIKFARELKTTDITVTGEPEITIKNIVASGRLECTLDAHELERGLLNTLVHEFPELEYRPKVFPGAVYRMKSPRVTFLIFSDGKIVCVGAKKEEDVYEAVEKLRLLLMEPPPPPVPHTERIRAMLAKSTEEHVEEIVKIAEQKLKEKPILEWPSISRWDIYAEYLERNGFSHDDFRIHMPGVYRLAADKLKELFSKKKMEEENRLLWSLTQKITEWMKKRGITEIKRENVDAFFVEENVVLPPGLAKARFKDILYRSVESKERHTIQEWCQKIEREKEQLKMQVKKFLFQNPEVLFKARYLLEALKLNLSTARLINLLKEIGVLQVYDGRTGNWYGYSKLCGSRWCAKSWCTNPQSCPRKTGNPNLKFLEK